MVKFVGLPKREHCRRSPSQLCAMQYTGNIAEFLSNFLRGPRLLCLVIPCFHFAPFLHKILRFAHAVPNLPNIP